MHTHSINRRKKEKKDEFGHQSTTLLSNYAKHHLYVVRHGSKVPQNFRLYSFRLDVRLELVYLSYVNLNDLTKATGIFVTAIMGEVYYRDYFDIVSGQAALECLLGTACFIFIISMLGWSGAYKHHVNLLKGN